MEEIYENISVYDYLKYCSNHKYIKGVGIITNKQFVFVVDSSKQGYSHREMEIYLQEQICPYLDDSDIGWGLEDFTSLFSIGDDFVIALPENGELSRMQFEFISRALDDVKKYNKELPEPRRIKVHCFSPELRDIPITSDTDLIKNILKSWITKDITLRDEEIIGETLTEDEAKEKLRFHLSFDDCQTVDDIINRIKSFRQYYNDEFYQFTFLDLVPDYGELLEFIDFPDTLDEDNKTLVLSMFDN